MWLFIQTDVLYPWIIKLIFVSFFLSQLFANYVVVQRWTLPRDVIKEVPLRTVTACVMECSQTKKCIAVGFRKDPDYSKNDKCLLVKMLRKKNKNGTRFKIFALMDEQSALKDEKVERLAVDKQRTCQVDVNGGYGNWSQFTVCSKSCGSGLQFRNRSCNNPAPMYGGRNCSIIGNATESRSCNQNPCQIDGGYGQWTSYGSCSKSCATGSQQRSRSCDSPTPQNGGKDCKSLGNSTERRLCNKQSCHLTRGSVTWFNPQYSTQNGRNYVSGLIGIKHNTNEWYTICDDYFDQNNNGAKVLCRMAGYYGGIFEGSAGKTTNPFIKGYDSINGKKRTNLKLWYFSYLKCSGDEINIMNCPMNTRNENACGHHEDVGIKCWY